MEVIRAFFPSLPFLTAWITTDDPETEVSTLLMSLPLPSMQRFATVKSTSAVLTLIETSSYPDATEIVSVPAGESLA